MVHRSSRRGRRGRRELLIMRLRPALVWFLLLSLTRMAESDDCEGKIGHVKFCGVGDNLKLVSGSSTDSVTWTFEGQSGSIPSRATYDPATEKQTLKLGKLSAADSGKYTATYGSSTTKTFSILVGAVTCDAGPECKVVTGSSIKMDSAAGSAIDVSWTHTKPDAPETAIDEANKFTDDKKKEMGRFNMQLADAGTYKAKYPNPSPTTTATFTVSVQAPITAVKIAGKVSACAGKSVILECKVTGDAKVVTWKKGTTPQATNVSGKKLTISEAKPEDAERRIYSHR
ncbi:hemicentin-2-like [Syngnathus acus]|uniref:hemicentin-2-like n=1 Tax=Syngnathus acus TaxID=161584 RepID=UPI00188633A8|nr:hemicentin-2-like [Syngnathus acus]